MHFKTMICYVGHGVDYSAQRNAGEDNRTVRHVEGGGEGGTEGCARQCIHRLRYKKRNEIQHRCLIHVCLLPVVVGTANGHFPHGTR